MYSEGYDKTGSSEIAYAPTPLRRRQAPLHGASGAARPSMDCPQRHRANTQRLIFGASPNFTACDAVGVGEDAVKIVYSGGYDRLEVQKRRTTPTPPMSAPGGLARRFWSDASANHMSVTSLREHSLPNIMARHRTLRRAMAVASAKMPRTCISVSVRARVQSSDTVRCWLARSRSASAPTSRLTVKCSRR